MFALIDTESSCREINYVGGKGIMQLTGELARECAGKSSEEYTECNIDQGTDFLADLYTSINSRNSNLTNEEKIKLTLFAYHRGLDTANKAIRYYNENNTLEKAMQNACMENYSLFNGCAGYDNQACCGLQGNRNGSPHPGTGLGADYPRKILEKYYSACNNNIA